jgi:AraC-like DNA-binding protein
MPLITVLARDPDVHEAAWRRLRANHVIARTASWERLWWLVRERPVTAVVLDSAAMPAWCDQAAAVGELRRTFPSVATVFVTRPQVDPWALFRLGRAGIESLVPLPLEALSSGIALAARRALRFSTDALVTRAVSTYLPAREMHAVRLALDGVQMGWSADDLAHHAGLTRAHLSVRLKAVGLPSAGHLLIWAKLLHAGRWLTDPGRTGESVSRQLEYSSGAAFRRVLRSYVGRTPSEVRERGGMRVVLQRFVDAHGLRRPGLERSAA